MDVRWASHVPEKKLYEKRNIFLGIEFWVGATELCFQPIGLGWRSASRNLIY